MHLHRAYNTKRYVDEHGKMVKTVKIAPEKRLEKCFIIDLITTFCLAFCFYFTLCVKATHRVSSNLLKSTTSLVRLCWIPSKIIWNRCKRQTCSWATSADASKKLWRLRFLLANIYTKKKQNLAKHHNKSVQLNIAYWVIWRYRIKFNIEWRNK